MIRASVGLAGDRRRDRTRAASSRRAPTRQGPPACGPPCRWARRGDGAPELSCSPGRHDRYGEVSRQLHEVFEGFTPLVEPIALDEAFLDVSGCHRLFGSSTAIARRDSCPRPGRAPNALLGRDRPLASFSPSWPLERPSRRYRPTARSRAAGVFVVRPEDELDFLHPRPVSDLWGVGPRRRPSGSLATGSRPSATWPRSTRRTSGGWSAGRQGCSFTSSPGAVTIGRWSRTDRSSRSATRRHLQSTCTIRKSSGSKPSVWPTRSAPGYELGFRGPDGDRQGPIRRLHDDHAVALAPPADRLVSGARKDLRSFALGRRSPPGRSSAGCQRVLSRSFRRWCQGAAEPSGPRLAR